MDRPSFRRRIALLLIPILLFSAFPLPALAETISPAEEALSSTEAAQLPTQASEPPTEATEAPAGMAESHPTETAPSTEATQAPPGETTVPTEATAPPTEEATGATEATEPPTEETTGATEATEPPTEETTAAAEATEPPAGLSAVPTVPMESRKFRLLPLPDDSEPGGPQLYFGQLHSHGDTAEALFRSAADAGLHFYAVTPCSSSFDNAASGSLAETGAAVSQLWQAGKAAAQTVTGTDFAGIFGFELNWPEQMQIGHINVFNTPGFRDWNADLYRDPYAVLEDFYKELAAVPGAIAQWNHPGNQYGSFFRFDCLSPEADQVMTLLEVANTTVTTADSYLDGYDYYTRALDAGWHVAPTNSQGAGRTVISVPTLTEESLYDALRNYRVYATEDSDLEIFYTMDSHSMGSRLKKRHTGETADILADLYDPTDSAIGLVEVIADGGTVADRQSVDTDCDVLRFSIPADYSYYYLRITQPDGDVAVTAPIWVESTEYLGISNLTCETEIPVQNEDISLKLELHNRETADFLVESVKILADGILMAEDTALSGIPAGQEISHSLSFRNDGIGQTEITAVLCGTLEGAPREYRETILLSFRQSKQVTDIVIDGSHGNAGLSGLEAFKAMASRKDIRITVADTGITEELLKNCRFLMVTAPAQPFSEAFLETAAEYVRCGGSMLLCGQSAALDEDIPSALQLNRLLKAIGSSIRMNRDTLTDPVHNGGEETLLLSDAIDTDSPWCTGVTDAQVYRHAGGCSVTSGNGTVLVSRAPDVMVVWEQMPAGGAVLAAGSLLPGDAELKEPANLWDAPYANRTIAENLLGIGGEVLPLSTVRQARDAEDGTLLRIRGYVTAGTANIHNRFPNTLYLQDDTGGIAVMPFTAEGIAVGTPVEITGAAGTQAGNRCLKLLSHTVLNLPFYRYLPITGDWKQLLDPALHGGELVQVEGECTEVRLSENGTVSDIFLKDGSGNTAHVHIEDYIFSGATGENDLHRDIRKGRKIRAIGILHIDENGDPVIRVRNCEEVVYVPPRKIYINPKTGDWLGFLMK